MKYRVMKDFRLNDNDCYKVGDIFSPEDCIIGPTGFLILNGFIEEIKDEPWKPKEGDVFYAIENPHGEVVRHVAEIGFNNKWWNDYEELGDCFQTKEQAEKALEWLKAFKVLRDDTHRFKPDWKNRDEAKYAVYYDFVISGLHVKDWFDCVTCPIYFATEADAEESIKKHEKEWKVFLGVEDEASNSK